MEYGLVALWLATYLLLLYVGMPIARLVMPDLADFGAGVALPLALSILWIVAYLVGHLSITAGLWLGLALVGVLALALTRYWGVEIDHGAYVEVALVFAAAFCFLIAIRAVDPAAHPGGGEKFLDMGLLQSSLRAHTVPPEDAWFAGQTVRYYFGGHFLASLLARMTGTEARYAYNLALSGYYAMLVTAAYGLAGSIAAHRGFSAKRAGIASAFFVGIASNLQPALRFGTALLHAAAAKAGPAGVLFDLLAGGWYHLAALFLPLPHKNRAIATSLDHFGYWFASRVIKGTIDEFPFFSWLNGDLHAHMMSTPFLLLLAAILFQVFAGGDRRSRKHTLLILLGIAPIVGGLIAVFNTWSFPAVGGLTVLALALAPRPPARVLSLDRLPRAGQIRDTVERRVPNVLVREGGRLVFAVLGGVLVLALAYCWSAPYWLWTASTNNGPALFPDRSTLAELLVTHGAFVLLFWIYLYRHGRAALGSTWKALAGLAGAVALVAVTSPGHTSDVGLSGIVSAQLNAGSIGLFVPLIVVGWILLRRAGRRQRATTPAHDRDEAATGVAPATDGSGLDVTPPGFETVLLLGAVGLILIVEFAYVNDGAFDTRLNTVFKVYMQVWVLASVAAGVVLVRLLEERAPSLGLSGPLGRRSVAALDRGSGWLGVSSSTVRSRFDAVSAEWWWPSWRHCFGVLGVVVVAATSLYAFFALGNHFGLTPGKAGVAVPYLGFGAPAGWESMLLWLALVAVVGGFSTWAFTNGRFEDPRPTRRAGLRLLVGLLVVSAGLYGSLSIVTAYGQESPQSIQRTDSPTLDALAFVETTHPGEAPAIFWLDDHVRGQPNMLSQPGIQYAWNNGPSSLTGVPAVAGSPPEAAYRGNTVYDRRVADVKRMFNGRPAVQRQLLAHYHVQLIYAGPNERDKYGPITVDQLDAVTVAKQWDVVTIYRVDQDALSG